MGGYLSAEESAQGTHDLGAEAVSYTHLDVYKRQMLMCIVWEGKPMRKMFSVLHYEYKMQFKRLVTWRCV